MPQRPLVIAENLRNKVSGMNVLEQNKKDIVNFDQENIARGLTANARIHYLRILSKLIEYTNKPLKELQKEDLIAFFNSISIQYSPESMYLYKSSVKKFWKWLYGDDEVTPTAVRWVKRERQDKLNKIPKILSPEEIRKMLDVIDNPRDKALVHVLYESACRVGELLNMKIGDIRHEGRMIKIVVSGKTGERPIILINSVPDLTTWLNNHPYKNNPECSLWTTIRNPKSSLSLETSGADTLLKKYAVRAGIKKRIYCHLLRHSRLTSLAKQFSESELKIIAGWTGDSKQARTYIHLNGADITRKFKELNGLVDPKEVKSDEEILKPKQCPRCQNESSNVSKFCNFCGLVLDLKTAMEMDKKTEESIPVVKGMKILLQNPKIQNIVKEEQDLQEMLKQLLQ